MLPRPASCLSSQAFAALRPPFHKLCVLFVVPGPAQSGIDALQVVNRAPPALERRLLAPLGSPMTFQTQSTTNAATGLAAFITAVVGCTVAHRVVNSATWRATKAKAIAGTSTSATALFSSEAPYRVGLLDLTVPSKRSGETYHQVLLANDISIERAVKSVGETLYVFLHEDSAGGGGGASKGAAAVSRPDMRCYLSELYGHFWDICNLHKNLQLDVRIFSTDVGGGRSPSVERDTLLLGKDLQAVFARSAQQVSESIQKKRAAKGLAPLELVSLDEDWSVAQTPCLYLEDDRVDIPHFDQVVLGGTFDRLHNGHKKLLSLAASICQKKLTIGVTDDQMLSKKKNADQIASSSERIAGVRSFLRSYAPPTLELDVIEIHDPFGPTIHSDKFDAIVVSSETIPGAVKINKLRAEKGLKPLRVVVTRRTVSSLLSSTFMRENVPRRPPRPKSSLEIEEDEGV